jgi:hypothetical protein
MTGLGKGLVKKNSHRRLQEVIHDRHLQQAGIMLAGQDGSGVVGVDASGKAAGR